MAIEPGCVPSSAVEAVVAGVINSTGATAFGSRNPARANRGALSLAMPHRVAYLPFGGVRRDRELRKAAQMGSWRFLVHERQVAVAGKNRAADEETFLPIAAVTATIIGADYKFGELSAGPFVEGTEEAIRRAEKLEQVRRGRFEACLLVVPSFYVVALWLQDRGGYGKTDILLPIPPSHSDLCPFEPMSEAAFVGILNKVTTKTIAYSAA